VRVTKSSAGIVVGGASDGRGAWLCRRAGATDRVDLACLDAALAKRAFARAWRTDVSADDEREIRERIVGHGDRENESDAQ
jgi:predicted RNA-binding protein YlxR (DUF448 family)